MSDEKDVPEVREAIDAESHPVLKDDATHQDAKLDVALDEGFATSDAPSQTRPGLSELAPSPGFDEEDERRIQEERAEQAEGATLTARFRTRRQADLAIEQLVQDQGVERTDVFVEADGADASSGVEADAADVESGHPGVEASGDPVLGGAILVSVDLADRERGEKLAHVLRGLDAESVDLS